MWVHSVSPTGHDMRPFICRPYIYIGISETIVPNADNSCLVHGWFGHIENHLVFFCAGPVNKIVDIVLRHGNDTEIDVPVGPSKDDNNDNNSLLFLILCFETCLGAENIF